MKKTFRFGALALSVLLAGGAFAACGTNVSGEDDDGRPKLKILGFDGGYGLEWLRDMARAYNKEHPENEYQISVMAEQYDYAQIKGHIESNVAEYDLFICNGQIYSLIDKGALEPLTSVFNSTPSGATESIKDMLTEPAYEKAYSKGNDIYAIPWQESVKGFIYDHDIFMQYGLLFKEDGTFVSSASDTLSVGKDGVPGTYDDGHPLNEAQWEAMVQKIAFTLGFTAFTYTGAYQIYLNDLFYSILGQYEGEDAFVQHFSLTGEYDFGGAIGKKTLTTDQSAIASNITALADAPGRMVALNFMDKYLANKNVNKGIQTPYVDTSAGKTSYSQTDAQNGFVYSFALNEDKKLTMLYDGDWWENESKGTFASLEESGVEGYDFKTRNYKFMTLPSFEGQKTPTTKSSFAIGESMYVALKKQKDETKKDIALDFMTFMYQPEWIQNYAVRCGGVMPYDVALTAEQEATLSPFAKNLRDVYYGENTILFNAQLQVNTYATMKSGMTQPVTTDSGYIIMQGLYNYSAQEYNDRARAEFTKREGDNNALYRTYIEAGGR